MSEAPASRYLELQVPEEQLLGFLAQEGALNDAALDALERQLDDAETEPGEAAGVALTVGRAGRASSATALVRVEARLKAAGAADEARAVALARALLSPDPEGQGVERADSGYRWTTEREVLYVEDVVAAHWHRQGRWGPPLRPDLHRPAQALTGPEQVDAGYEVAADGRVAIVTFRAPRWRRSVHAPLRLTRAGLARTPDLSDLVRWSAIASLGQLAHGDQARLAYARHGGGPIGLPPDPSIPADDLLALMSRLLKQSRA